MKTPNFFIVGAPKCGTTAMYEFLRKHPQIFMTQFKEPHFFCTDLKGTYFITDREKYFNLFSGSDGYDRIGEASGWYLYSSHAARAIQEFNPDARIIIMLRNPVDFMHSYHSQRLYAGTEDIKDFEEALDAEADRRLGRRMPANPDTPHGLFYKDVARFSQQVQRYLDVFGRERVHIILFDDFKQDGPGVYRGTLRFLGVREDFTPKFQSVNANKEARSRSLMSVLHRPPALAARIARLLMKPQTREKLKSSVRRLNTRTVAREPMAPELRKRLQAYFADEVEKLSAIVGKDLSHWQR